MSDSELLRTKLASVERGAAAFAILQVAFLVLGILVAVAAGLEILAERSWAGWHDAAQSALSAAGYLFIAWLSGRASDAFVAITALIREMAEIV
jgi:hypothetical protein